MLRLTTSASFSRRISFRFSRIRSNTTMVSLLEYPIRVRIAAITVSDIGLLGQRERADGDQRIVENRNHSRHSIDQLKPESQVNQHSQQRINRRQNSLLLQLGPHLRPNNLYLIDTEIREKETILQ